MGVITEVEIRALAGKRSVGLPIVSCYLDVDGARYVHPSEYEVRLENLLRRARGSGAAGDGTAGDLSRIEARVRDGFDRSHTRGVALFACADLDLFEVVELPVPVRDEIRVNEVAALAQLEQVAQTSQRLAVLAADKQHARVFVFRSGELVEHEQRTDDIGRDYDRTGEHDRGGVEPHRAELTHQHLRAAVDLLWSVHQHEAFDHLLLAASDVVAAEIERGLHPYLAGRLSGRLDVPAGASVAEIRLAVQRAEQRIEREREAAVVAELRDAAGEGSRAVVGLPRVLDVLAERRIERLIVSDGFEAEGWHCPACDRLATVGRECPSCATEMHHAPDLVEDAVDQALLQSCRVDVCLGNADLDVLGRIGALLRY